MVAVRVETELVFSTGTTSVLFADTAYLRNSARRQYDVTADVGRFIRSIGCATGVRAGWFWFRTSSRN